MHVSKRAVVLCLAPLLCTVPALSQAGRSIEDAPHGDENAPQVSQSSGVSSSKHGSGTRARSETDGRGEQPVEIRLKELSPGNRNGADSPVEPAIQTPPQSKRPEFSSEVYYRNKLEFSLDVGWHPINIPFPLDCFVGGDYNTYPLKYTLVPIIASLRWHVNGVGGPPVLRGNFDFTFSGSVTAIPRGPETRYYSYDMGIRRNFVPHRGKVDPYWDIRLGVGNIDAKGPLGVKYAQGQDITFTINMGSGVRYNFSPRYALSAGFNFMHISNLDLSESNGKPNWGVRNYGINVVGPMVGLDIQLRRRARDQRY